MRKTNLKIYQIFPYFAPYWTPKGVSPFTGTNLNPHPPSMLSSRFVWNWYSGSYLKGARTIKGKRWSLNFKLSRFSSS